jgi:hypothetical protein
MNRLERLDRQLRPRKKIVEEKEGLGLEIDHTTRHFLLPPILSLFFFINFSLGQSS